MTGSLTQYIALNLFLLLVFFLAGRNISKGKSYWKNAVWAILFFTFISGSRFGRGNDYMHYIEVYEYNLEETQVVFTWFNNVLKSFGVQAYFIFYFYAFTFVTCLMVFLQPFKKYANIVFPFALMATLSFEEFQIRQAFGFSLVFLFIYELMYAEHSKKIRIITCTILFFLCTGIHTANAIILLMILFFYLFFRKAIPWTIGIPLFLVATLLINNLTNLGFIQPVIDIFNDGSSDSKLSSYAENADRWFSADAKEDDYSRNIIVSVFETLGNISLLYLGYKAIRIYRDIRLNTFYNMYVTGTIILHSFMNLEILNRMGGDIMLFWFIPIALVLANTKRFLIKGSLLQKICFVFLIWWLYDYTKYIFMPADMPNMQGKMILYLWNFL